MKLIVFPGSPAESVVPLENCLKLALGRSRDCDVVLPRRMASRNHALIELKAGRYVIRDMDSYNGTFVNERPVRETELSHGDEIRIADCVIRFIAPQGETDAADPSAVTAPNTVDTTAPAQPAPEPPPAAAARATDEDTPAEMHHYTVTSEDVDLLDHEAPTPASVTAPALSALNPEPAARPAALPAPAKSVAPRLDPPTQPSAAAFSKLAPPPLPPAPSLGRYVTVAVLVLAGLLALALLAWRR